MEVGGRGGEGNGEKGDEEEGGWGVGEVEKEMGEEMV